MSQRKFATFYLGDALFGIDILLIREINRNIEITPVDLAHESIKGLINLRGQLVTIFDLGTLIGNSTTDLSETSCSIVLKTKAETEDVPEFQSFRETMGDDMCGVVVDRIGDIITADTSQFEAPPASISGIKRESIDHVIKLDGELLVILNIATLFTLSKQST